MQSQLRCSPRFSLANTSAKYEKTIGTAPPILKDKRRKNKAEKHNLKASEEGIL